MSSTVSSVLIIISTIVIVLTIGVASEGGHFLWLQKSIMQSDISQSHAVPFNNFLTSLWASYRANYYDSHDSNYYYGWGDGNIDWKTARELELNGWIKWEKNSPSNDYQIYEGGNLVNANNYYWGAGGLLTEKNYGWYLDNGVYDYSSGDTIRWGADTITSNPEVCRIYPERGDWLNYVNEYLIYHRLNGDPIQIGKMGLLEQLQSTTINDKYLGIMVEGWNNYTYAERGYNDLLLKNSGNNVILPLTGSSVSIFSSDKDTLDGWEVYIDNSKYSSPTDTTDIKRYHLFSNFFDYSQSGGKPYKYSVLDIYPSAYWHKVIGDSAIMSWLSWWRYFDDNHYSNNCNDYVENYRVETISNDGSSTSPDDSPETAVKRCVSNKLVSVLMDKMKEIVEDKDSNIQMDINKLMTWWGEGIVEVHVSNVRIINDNPQLDASKYSYYSGYATCRECADTPGSSSSECGINKTCVSWYGRYDAEVSSSGHFDRTPTIKITIDKIRIKSYKYKLKMDVDNCWDGTQFAPYESPWINVLYGRTPPIEIPLSNPIVLTIPVSWSGHEDQSVNGGYAPYTYSSKSSAEDAGEDEGEKWVDSQLPVVWRKLEGDYNTAVSTWDDWKYDAIALDNTWVASAPSQASATGGDEI